MKTNNPCEDLFKKAMKSLDFAEWVASEIMPDIEWINNRDAFPELACRRLEKLGIVEEKNGMWVRKERTNVKADDYMR